ncbi:hypothetical protein NDU88_004356 [Pleurodeles waltl]|uniref:Uncharacterized protein n=1 Tax=Pleurodeles waltl TaxID=8319 RepID=A0AAV7QCD6_PLEWA|nr:hypothetical protein NDU88_004356 [Pleurodeles waltl]
MLSTVIMEKFPEQGPALCKYNRVIYEEYTRNGGTGWLNYDREFRQKMEQAPEMAWDCCEIELWVQYMGNGSRTATSDPRFARHKQARPYYFKIQLRPPFWMCRLPKEKVTALQADIRQVLSRDKATLATIQSLLGRLNFAARIIPAGRIFARRLARATAKAKRESSAKQPQSHSLCRDWTSHSSFIEPVCALIGSRSKARDDLRKANNMQ